MQQKQTHLLYGFLTGLAIAIVAITLYVLGLNFEPWAQWVSYIPFIVGLILNAQKYAQENDHFVTFGKVFSSCFKAAAITALVVLGWSLISIYIFPEMKEKGMEIARQSMEEKGLADEQIEQAIEMTKKYFVPFMMGGIVFGYMFFGALFSLVAAAIPKKKGEANPVV